MLGIRYDLGYSQYCSLNISGIFSINRCSQCKNKTCVALLGLVLDFAVFPRVSLRSTLGYSLPPLSGLVRLSPELDSVSLK
jgi:hypothetical protein